MHSYDFLSAEEVAQYLQVGKNAVYQLAKSGKLSSYHIGRKKRFTLEDVEAYMESMHKTSDGSETEEIDNDTALFAKPYDELTDAASFGMAKGTPFVIAGADRGADIIASELNASGTLTTRVNCASYTALVNLYAGAADAAVTNLYDQSLNSWNLPYVKSLAPGLSVTVIRMYGERYGLAVQEGNPKNISTWGGLLRENVRLANRTKGSGARVLLDEKLRAMEARADTIDGYTTGAYGVAEAVRRVKRGLADVTVGAEREIRDIKGVKFIPLTSAWTDISIRKTEKTRTLVREIKDAFVTERLQKRVAAMPMCDFSKLGSVVYES